MNWGWKIFILYTGFVIMTLIVVIYTMTQKVELVTDDYYKEEIAYQKQIDRIKNAKRLKDPLTVEYLPSKAIIVFTFPDEHVKVGLDGSILFYRPSDTSEDRKVIIKPDDHGIQMLNVRKLPTGYWRVKVLWSSGGTEYYINKELVLQ